MSKKLATAHIIAHTHWDREWFLTSIYTSRWIPGLINQLERLVEQNPAFSFLFDGQTLVIEDLLALAPEYQDRVETLIQNQNLIIGPYYCQPDWQVTSGEALLRNLQLGAQDVRRYDGKSDTGWLVDTFGHISQSPQLHKMFGVGSVFVWRGVPEMAPYFSWQSPNNDNVFAINLFGGRSSGRGRCRASPHTRERIAETQAQLRDVEAQLQNVNGDRRYRLDHRRYVLERELYEYQLSAHLNALKLAQQGKLDEAYLFEVDDKTAEIGFKLNQLRIKRRIYDYIVQLK